MPLSSIAIVREPPLNQFIDRERDGTRWHYTHHVGTHSLVESPPSLFLSNPRYYIYHSFVAICIISMLVLHEGGNGQLTL